MNRDDETTAEAFGDDDVGTAPFGVADYLQLAGMGRRSVVLEIRGGLVGRGRIVVRKGEVWSAHDERGTGIEAFRRLVFLRDASIACESLDANEDEHNVRGSCEEVLFEAARLLDEALSGAPSADRANDAPDDEAIGSEPSEPTVVVDDGWDVAAPSSSPTRPAPSTRPVTSTESSTETSASNASTASVTANVASIDPNTAERSVERRDVTSTALPPPPSTRSSVTPAVPPPPRSPHLSLVTRTYARAGLLVEPGMSPAEHTKPTWRPPRPQATASALRPAATSFSSSGSATPTPSGLRGLTFEELYERGVDGLLAKDYFAAFLAFSQASELRVDARVTTNLTRLRQLGFGVTRASADGEEASS